MYRRPRCRCCQQIAQQSLNLKIINILWWMNQLLLSVCSIFPALLYSFIWWARFLTVRRFFLLLYPTRFRMIILSIHRRRKMCGSRTAPASDLLFWYQCAYCMNIDTELNRHRIVQFANALHRRMVWRHRLNVDDCKGERLPIPVHRNASIGNVLHYDFLNERSIFRTSTVLFIGSPSGFPSTIERACVRQTKFRLGKKHSIAIGCVY